MKCLSYNSYVKNRLMALMKLYMGQKMLKFWKLTSGNFKIGNFPVPQKLQIMKGYL